MKEIAKSMLYMGIGIGATIAYQKYSRPMMEKFEKMMDKTIKKVDDELEEMM